jgi:hypothetical protein
MAVFQVVLRGVQGEEIFMRARSQLCFLFAAVLFAEFSTAAVAKNASSREDENSAVVFGEAGERYPIVGVGGIRVVGGHHGWFTSNMKSSAIQIDGSGISAQKFVPVNVSGDFIAAANGAYFVSNVAICTLPTAVGAAGQEIVVCNTNKSGTITYQTVLGEVLLGGDQSGPVVSSIPGKVDKFISDGKGWYRE